MRLFVELDAQSDRIAGFHTGTNQHIGSDYINSPAVFQHESIHDEIFGETPDGILHAQMMQKLRRTEDEQECRILKGAIDRLFDETRLAHEAGATYLGILSLGSKTEKVETFAQLDDAYRSYFAIYDDLLSPMFVSTSVKFAMASAINRWAFCSPRIERVTSAKAVESGGFWEIPGPTERLRAITEVIGATGADALRRSFTVETSQIAASLGWSGLDLRDDGSWSTKAHEVRRRLDHVATLAAGVLVERLAPLPVLRRFKIPDYFEETRTSVLPRWYGPDQAEASAWVERAVALHVARRASTRRIYRLLERPPSGDEGWVSEVLRQVHGKRLHMVAVARQKSDGVEYVVRCFTHPEDGSSPSPSTVTSGQLRQLFEGLRTAAACAAVCLVYVVEEWRVPEHRSTLPFPEAVLVPMQVLGLSRMLSAVDWNGMTCTILAYAHAEWAEILHRYRGTISIFDIYMGRMADVDTPSLLFVTFTEVGSTLEASASFFTKIDFRSIRPLLDHAVAEGRIRIEAHEPGVGFQNLFEALWSTLETL